MDVLFKTKKIITENGLIDPGDNVLATVSGGIDSMVLLNLLENLKEDIGFFLSVAHINHKLRGADSDEDERFVEDFCKRRKLVCKILSWKGSAKGENIQEAARDFRYKSFIRISNKIGATKVALAHNMDDQAETVLLNLIRGAGLDGICGMHFKMEIGDNLHLIRPLLYTSRDEIERYAAEKTIPFRNDVTNDQTKYTRNFVRHRIVPLVKEINPKALKSISEMADLLKSDEEYIINAAKWHFGKIVLKRGQGIIEMDHPSYVKIVFPIRVRLLKLAYIEITGSVAGITRDHLIKMDDIAMRGDKEGSYNLHAGACFEKRRARLAIFKK